MSIRTSAILSSLWERMTSPVSSGREKTQTSRISTKGSFVEKSLFMFVIYINSSTPAHQPSQTTLAVLLGPKVAEKGEGGGAGGYADKFGMQSITVPTIAFMAVLVSTLVKLWCDRRRTFRAGPPCTVNRQQVRLVP